MVKIKKKNEKSVKTTNKKKRFIVNIIKERCKGCLLCVVYCPEGVLGMSDSVNIKGNFFPIIIDQSKCIGCKLCFKICPDFSIFVENK